MSTENPSAFYQHSYDGPSEWRELGAQQKASNILTLCGDQPYSNVLDIGAGEGALLQKLSATEFAEQYAAVEVSESGINTIREREIPNLLDVRKIDGDTLPFEADQFDLAILSHVVEHLDNPRALVREAARVARWVFIEVPLEDNSRKGSQFNLDATGHINFFAPKTLRLFVQTCGLRIENEMLAAPSLAAYRFMSGTTGVLPFLVKASMLRLAPAIATRLWTYHMAVLCRPG